MAAGLTSKQLFTCSIKLVRITNMNFLKSCFGKYFYALIFLTVLLLAAVPLYADIFSDAQKDYIYGDYQDSIDKLERLKGNQAAAYLLGLNYFKLGDYGKAREYFSIVIRLGGRASFNDEAMIKMADTYFLEKNYIKAKSQYLYLLQSSKASNFLPIIYLRLAQIASKQNDWSTRNQYLNKIKTQFPKSAEMKYVTILESYGNYYTIQVGAFGSVENARAIQEDLRSRNDVYIVKENKGDMTIYKVRVGKFSTHEQAEKICNRLTEAGYPAIIYP